MYALLLVQFPHVHRNKLQKKLLFMDMRNYSCNISYLKLSRSFSETSRNVGLAMEVRVLPVFHHRIRGQIDMVKWTSLFITVCSLRCMTLCSGQAELTVKAIVK